MSFLTLSRLLAADMLAFNNRNIVYHSSAEIPPPQGVYVVFPRDGPATAAIVWFLVLEDQTTAKEHQA
jgi:hypothetical protein